MNTPASRAAILASLFALAACGGGGDSGSAASTTGAGPIAGPAPAPAPGTGPAPAPAPAPAAVQNSLLCGTPITGNAVGGNQACSITASPSGNYQGTVRPVVDICLGSRNCSYIAASTRIDAAPSYRGAFTARLVSCKLDPGRTLTPDCTEPTRNDADHLGFIDFRWDAPNGNAGPSTSLTYQVLTSTDGAGLMRCGANVFSDADHVRIDDEAGNSLFLAIHVAATSC